jgi:hypothetical protein
MLRFDYWGKTFTLLLLSLLISGAALAQETTGGIRGTVTDASGAVIPGASVQLTSPSLMRAALAATDATGGFSFLSIPGGSYTIVVNAQAFVPVKRMNIDLTVGKILRIDFRLEVGGTQQTVEVMSDAAIVDVSQSTVVANVTASSFDHLPKGRAFDSLIALAPGARYEAKSNGYQVDGASGSENVFIIDGMDQTSIYSGGLNRTGQIPFEFVQELQIKSSGFEAEYGGAMGGVINVVTKSGSNQWHGDGGFYFDSDVLRSAPRPYQDLDPDNNNVLRYIYPTRDGYRFLNPGASIGGPIKQDKVWFFAGWYPEFRQLDRKVTFNRDNTTKTFYQSERNDFLNGKVDAAPIAKLRLYGGYIYSPQRNNGRLPALTGKDDPANPWGDLGMRTPTASYTFGGDYMATSKLILSARGGYNYRNYKDYGVPRQTAIIYASSNKGIPGVPAEWVSGSGTLVAANEFTERDIQTRFRTSTDAAYVLNFHGQHTLKAGWEINQLHNDPNQNSYPDGYLRYFWDTAYTSTVGNGKMKGAYGYLRYRYYGTTGNVSSSNQSLFVQDSWQVRKGLTVLLGLRTEREYVPSFAVGDNIPSKAITFGFGQKLAPRIGFAWDVKGDGKWKVAGSIGQFYDLMKYAMPQGSFGGQKWKDYFYPLDNANPAAYLPMIPRDSSGIADNAPLKGLKLFEQVNWRIPSNDPSDNTIDPNLQPMSRRVYDISTDYALTPTLVLSARFTHNSMDHAIEDVGTLTPAGEKYYIANPGYGITIDPKTWDTGYPLTPKAKRNYNAVEVRLDKQFAKNYYFLTSYTWSRQYGNYSGLASSDEPDATTGVGRTDPSVSRYFDLPYMSYDSQGKLVEGLLATDRPHTFKLFGAYTWKNKFGETNIGPNFFIYSGTPLTTELQMISTVPVYVNGRGDLGRTSPLSQTDLYIYHEFKVRERWRFKIDANCSNLFNQGTATSNYVNYLNRNEANVVQFDNDVDFFKGFDWKTMVKAQDLHMDPGFNRPSFFQGFRDMRLGFKVTF